MNTSKIASLAAAMLLAGGMMFAQTGDLPALRGVNESGVASAVSPDAKLPGSVGTLETPTTGIAASGQRPGTGVQDGETGTVVAKASALPGAVAVGM